MEQLAYVHEALVEGVRLSGRRFNERRPLQVTFGPQVGQCTIKLGTTVAVGTVNASIIMPPPEKPSEGLLQVSTQLSQLSQEGDRTSGQSISNLVDRLIRGSRVLDPQSLCILSGRRVWHLRVMLQLITNHGNAVDACGLAAIGALMHFRKQEVAVQGRDVVIYHKNEMEPIALPILHHPLIVSAAVIELHKLHEPAIGNSDNLVILIDPDHQEELASTTTLNIACNGSGDVCLINKAGGTPLPFSSLFQHIEQIRQHAKELATILTDALETELLQREGRRKDVHSRQEDLVVYNTEILYQILRGGFAHQCSGKFGILQKM